MAFVAKGENTLFCPTLFFISPRTTKGHIKLVQVQRLLQTLSFHDVGMQRTAVIKGVDVFLNALWVGMNDKLHIRSLRHSIAKIVHGLELPPRIHMHQGKRRRTGVKGFAR